MVKIMNVGSVYHCNNLDLLKHQCSGEVNLIYCDILYGTGKKFKDYEDLKPIKNIIFDFYTSMFQEMHRVLNETGTICIQMDYRIVHWIRCLLDDIFKYENFRNQIVVKYNLGGRTNKEFPNKHDYIVVYGKSKKYTFNDLDVRVPYKSVVSKKQDRPNITKEKLEIGTIPTNVWDDIPNGLKVKKRTDYFSEKHPKILERLIKAYSNEGDLVADYFCGSGTTAYVASKLNRRFIGCDINEVAVKHTLYELGLDLKTDVSLKSFNSTS
jgi:DNA modification methylase